MNPVSDSIAKLSTSAVTAVKPLDFSRRLASALLWDIGQAKVEQVPNPGLSLDVVRAFSGGEPAVYFFGCKKLDDDAISNAALYAYHSTVQWGILTDVRQTVVFNSHWLKHDRWFQTKKIPRKELGSRLILFEALTPRGLIEGDAENVAVMLEGAPDRLLVPVDDSLVDRLDWWREEAMRHATIAEDLDEKIQTLFAQLFVLRVVEDRKLTNLPKLLTVLEDGKADLRLLRKIFEEAKRTIQSELFDVEVPNDIPPSIQAGIIQDLYRPHELPMADARYNFAWIDADVLGRAYQKYLSTIVLPVKDTKNQLYLFDPPVREARRVTRKTAGAYYTPQFAVRYLTEKCLDDHFSSSAGNLDPPRIVDLSCGSGSFLIAALDSLIRRLRNVDPSQDWPRILVANKSIVGIDIDKRAVTLARLSIWLRLAEEPSPLPLPDLDDVIVCGDALTEASWIGLPEVYHIVLGNPPYVAIKAVENRVELTERFATAQGRFDYSYLFVELALRRLEGGGLVGLVLPNRIFGNRDASILRNMICDRANLLTLVDFGITKVFPGTKSYVSLVVFKIREEAVPDTELRFVKVNELPTNLVGAMLADFDSGTEEKSGRFMLAYSLRQPSGAKPWLLMSPASKMARIRLEGVSEPLSEFASISQGIKTGANDVFIVEIESPPVGSVWKVRNGLGESFAIESANLRPVIYGTEIRRFSDISPGDRYLIYPYRSGQPISEDELRNEFALTFNYLFTYQDLLEARSGIGEGSKRWYELVRSREESWLTAPKLLMRDLAPETSFARDSYGSMFLVGGTAVIPEDSNNLDVLLGYLNSRLATWFLSKITPSFRDGFQKVEPQHLNQLSVPVRLVTNLEVRDEISELAQKSVEAFMSGQKEEQRACEAKIDQILYRITGLDEDLI